MKTFKTKNSEDIYGINETNFEITTSNLPPYKIEREKDKYSYFAICPSCDNPVQLIGLYKREKTEIAPYGKHHSCSIRNLGNYDAYEVEHCPFFNGGKYSGDTKIKECEKTNKLYKIFLKHADAIYRVFTLITGIVMTNGLLRFSAKNWFTHEKWRYYAANKVTLPFMPFYGSIPRLFGMVIYEDSDLFNFLYSIKSKYNIVFVKNYDNECVQVTCDKSTYLPLRFDIQEYHCSQSGEQSFKLKVIDASKEGKEATIKKFPIQVDNHILDEIIHSGYSNHNVLDYIKNKEQELSPKSKD